MEIDGIIINQDDMYFQQKIFKWKPADKLTIDFYVEKNDQYSNVNFVAYTLFTNMTF